MPALVVSPADAGRLARGQTVLLRGRDAPVVEGWVAVSAQGSLVALAEAQRGELHPRRISTSVNRADCRSRAGQAQRRAFGDRSAAPQLHATDRFPLNAV